MKSLRFCGIINLIFLAGSAFAEWRERFTLATVVTPAYVCIQRDVAEGFCREGIDDLSESSEQRGVAGRGGTVID
jgi:hypothetical protein